MSHVPQGSTPEVEELWRWARQAELADPLPWPELEARILAVPAPSSESPAADLGTRSPAARVLLTLVLAPLWLPVLALVPGAALTGLGFVVAHVRFDREPSGGLAELLVLLFWASVITGAVPVLMWMSTRRRGPVMLGVSGATALASAVSFWLLATAPTYQQAGVWSSLESQAAIAAVVGTASLLFLLVVAVPHPRLTLRELLRVPSPEEQWRRGLRAGVLEQLVKRGLVASDDVTNLMTMPRGAWQELESRPDGRVVRHRS